MEAIVYQGDKKVAVEDQRPLPKLRDEYILVKVAAIGLNPTDWKGVNADVSPIGGVVGVDYAGTVVEVGSKVTRDFKKGDRICGTCMAGNKDEPEGGAFAEYIVAKGDVRMKIPDNLSFEQAATLGVGIVTVGQGLFDEHGLQLSWPSNPIQKPENVLLYGGSTATGTLGIQFLKLARYTVLTTCSPKNFELVKSLGADLIFDYKDPDCVKKIKEVTNNDLKYAWDCVGAESSAKLCCDVLSSGPDAHYGTAGFAQPPRKDVKYTFSVQVTSFGQAFERFGKYFPAQPAHYEFAKKRIGEAVDLVGKGNVKVHPISVREGGLQGAIQGMADMKEGKYGAEKLVYKVAETPESGIL